MITPRSGRLALAGVVVVSLAMVIGCASTPGQRLDRLAERRGLDVRTLRVAASTGESFHLRAYSRSASPAARTLHIYLEGDGVPWIGGTRVADDPHGRRVLAFELMLRDPAPAVYIERPCYHRLDDDDACRPELWTSARYSETVVSSLEQAIRELLVERGQPRLTLIGYSGGGVLATLLAHRLPTAHLITVAANLDVAAWVEHHGYLALTGSLDPAHLGPPPVAEQLHLLGGDDPIVPPTLVQPLLERWGVPFERRPGFGHVCCWLDAWPAIVQR